MPDNWEDIGDVDFNDTDPADLNSTAPYDNDASRLFLPSQDTTDPNSQPPQIDTMNSLTTDQHASINGDTLPCYRSLRSP